MIMWGTYPDFIDNIECILITRKREPDLGQCVCCSVGCGSASTIKGISKVCFRVFHGSMTAENYQASNPDAKFKLAFPTEHLNPGKALLVSTYNINVTSLISPMAFASLKDHLV